MKRIVSGLVAASIILLGAYLNTAWPLFAVSTAGMLVCWFEFIRSSRAQIFSTLPEKVFFFTLLLVSYVGASLNSLFPASLELFCLCFVLLTAMSLFGRSKVNSALPNLLLFYLSLLPALCASLLFLENGKFWFLYLMFTVFFGDIFAFYIGARFGRKKLLPSVSPKKTWEGSFAGLFGSTVVSTVFVLSFGKDLLPLILAPPLGLALGLCGQVGDLFESDLKRSLSLKDAGQIMPGHGGLLDRLDGVFFAGPILLLFLKLSGF